MIRIYDTLSRETKVFSPISKDNKVRMYSCGMTVQDSPHLGHLRALITADIIRRVMKIAGYDVFSVYNFTDIDDKLIDKMKTGEDYRILAQRNIDTFMTYAKKMRIIPFDVYPRATGHIQEIVEFVEKLVYKGYAYQVDGDVFFKVAKFDNYGKLSGKNTKDLIKGKRVEINQKKENPLDFVLWKKAKEGEPYWHSPFGKGRPGWHIECSAMSIKYLGETFDIHTGGEDLIFPHHENEIAQSECATGKHFANFWIHNGMVNMKGEKMSKSLGNDFKLKEIFNKWDSDVVRLYLMKTHYRKSMDFSEERLNEAKNSYKTIESALTKSEHSNENHYLRNFNNGNLSYSFMNDFKEALYEDFNTPKAIGIVFDAINDYNKSENKELQKEIREMVGLLGFKKKSNKKNTKSNAVIEIESLIKKRKEARERGDYITADRIRDELKEKRIVLFDSKEGTTWKTED